MFLPSLEMKQTRGKMFLVDLVTTNWQMSWQGDYKWTGLCVKGLQAKTVFCQKYIFFGNATMLPDLMVLGKEDPVCMKLDLSFKFSTRDVLYCTHLAAWHESVWTWMSCEPSSSAESYLGGSIGVHQNHVLCALFDLELNVILSFQGGQAAVAGAHSRFTVGGVWGQWAFWVKTKKVTI